MRVAMNLNNRSFKLWDYKVSHNQLLLRSPKTATTPTNVDVAFVGVEYLELPTKLANLALVPAGAADLDRVKEAFGEVGTGNEVFVIQVMGRRFIIVAAAMHTFENELEIFESSLERFSVQRP
jgi:hypothetical protein